MTNTLSQNEGKDDKIDLGDKQLHPINNNYYIGISKHFEIDQEIIILNKYTKNAKKKKCNISSNSDFFMIFKLMKKNL